MVSRKVKDLGHSWFPAAQAPGEGEIRWELYTAGGISYCCFQSCSTSKGKMTKAQNHLQRKSSCKTEIPGVPHTFFNDSASLPPLLDHIKVPQCLISTCYRIIKVNTLILILQMGKLNQRSELWGLSPALTFPSLLSSLCLVLKKCKVLKTVLGSMVKFMRQPGWASGSIIILDVSVRAFLGEISIWISGLWILCPHSVARSHPRYWRSWTGRLVFPEQGKILWAAGTGSSGPPTCGSTYQIIGLVSFIVAWSNFFPHI